MTKTSCFLLLLSSLLGSLLHPRNLLSASVQGSAHCGGTQAAHIWLEFQWHQWTFVCSPLLLSSSFQSNKNSMPSGRRPHCSVQRSDKKSGLTLFFYFSHLFYFNLHPSFIISCTSCFVFSRLAADRFCLKSYP